MRIAAIVGKSGRIKANHRSDGARAKPGDQAVETRSRGHAARRWTEVIVDRLDFLKPPLALQPPDHIANAGSQDWGNWRHRPRLCVCAPWLEEDQYSQ